MLSFVRPKLSLRRLRCAEKNTQGAALVAVSNVYEWLDEMSIRKMVLPKIKIVFEKNHNDFKIVANVLQCIERTLDKLDKSQVPYIDIDTFDRPSIRIDIDA